MMCAPRKSSLSAQLQLARRAEGGARVVPSELLVEDACHQDKDPHRLERVLESLAKRKRIHALQSPVNAPL